MDFTAPSFSLGLDFDDPPPADDPREEARGYEAPDAPSFSLGLDFECYDDGDEPRIPAGGRSVEPDRRYEAPDAPSFSLGLGFDDDGGATEPQIPAGARREDRPRRYEAPDAPSFSLGIDDDDDGGASEPHHLPAGGYREEQAPRYEAPDAPSFSLGIDDDDDFVAGGALDPEPLPPQPETNRLRRLRRGPAPRYEAPDAPSFSLGIDDDDDDFVAGGTINPDPLPPQPETNRLKRLRRGPAPRSMAPPPAPARAAAPMATEASPDFSRKAAPLGDIGSYEDEIEGFSDEEIPRGMTPSVSSCRTSSNSKFSLLNRSVLMTQPTSKAKTTKSTPISNSVASNSVASKPLEESCTKKLFPKITISPLRKIYFVDSDTDSDDNKKESKPKKPVSPIKKRQESMHKYMQKKPILQQNSKSEGSTVVQKSEHMMKDNWATPALDDFCSEYFKSVQDSRPSQQTKTSSISGSKVSGPYSSVSEFGEHFQHESTSARVVLKENLTDNHPPAMHYFCHHDQMVQNLVRERLKHFLPIGAGTSKGNEYGVEENLNYRTQFGQSGGANDRWVTPNSRTSVPTDFGKRRVHAGGSQSSSGHWFTGEDGRKVYVSKNGQELTGRDAYKQYKKESGKGFRNFKKKKSTVKKEGSARAKRGSSTAKKASSSSTAKRSSGAKRKR